jgi:CRP-like cAMP-binding protein
LSGSFDQLFRRWERRVLLSNDDKRAVEALPWTYRAFARESYMLREGEAVVNCTLLVSGFAYRQKLVNTGARQIICFHIPGEFVDLQNLMLQVADHNVQSLGRSQVATVSRTALSELMAARPAVRQAIWLDTLIDSSVFREWVVNLGRRDARTRIAHLLCELADRLRSAGASDGSMYEFPITQEQIADATGLTSVHTNRTLQSLRKEGLISLSSSRLEIADWDGLVELADFNERYLHHGV